MGQGGSAIAVDAVGRQGDAGGGDVAVGRVEEVGGGVVGGAARDGGGEGREEGVGGGD